METILIVDDTKANIQILMELLDERYDVIASRDGQGAIEMAIEDKPDLILLDVVMPEMDGFEVCRELKKNKKTKEIPIIFLTAQTNEDSIEKAYEVGGIDYITKPFKQKELLARVKRELKLVSLINQLKDSQQDNLEYASFVQESLLPAPKNIRKSFDDFFIIYNKKDIVSPLTYNFFKINDNESLFLIIDCHIEGIKSAFYTMFLNSIEKEMISYIKENKEIEVSSRWIYNFIDDSIKQKLLQDEDLEYDIGIVYHNKKNNTLGFSGNNSIMWYLEDDRLKEVQSPGGLSDEILFDLKEDFYFYLSTKNISRSKISFNDIHNNLLKPIDQQEKLFKDLIDEIEDVIFCGFRINNKIEMIIEYEGLFTQDILGSFTDTIEDRIENIGIISNILTILSEQFQNTMNYSKVKDPSIDIVSSKGYISLQETPHEYIVTSKNLISLNDKEKIEPKLNEIRSLDRQGIRKRYKELRKSGVNTHNKGGGIGFYEIAKRCNEVLYDFEIINSERFTFTYKSILKK